MESEIFLLNSIELFITFPDYIGLALNMLVNILICAFYWKSPLIPSLEE